MSKSRKHNQSVKKISTWEELSECKSETHTLGIDVDGCNGWILPKIKNTTWNNSHYLSTHTFYGTEYNRSTKLLQSCGFNVEISNWDLEEDDK